MRIESLGEDGEEFQLLKGGIIEHWQAKRQVTGQDTWTLRKLASEGVLTFFYQKFREGGRCVFASVSDSPELRMLTENAVAVEKLGLLQQHLLDKKRTRLFQALKGYLNSRSDQEVFDFLRSVIVHGGREITLEGEFGFRLSVLFKGPWQTTIAILRDFYLRSVHETLSSQIIETSLEKLGVTRRRLLVSAARDLIGATTQTFLAGQKAKLIGGVRIRRSVADEVVSSILASGESLDFLITSAAGGGKSGCLGQIVETLQFEGIPVLAFRLDHLDPAPTSIALGENMGLGESPAFVLAQSHPGQTVALVIDQIDCVSGVSGRHPNFFDVLAALREEVVGLRPHCRLHLVMACRQFDFDHDHRLKQLLKKDQQPLIIGELADDEVREVLLRSGGEFSNLNIQQQRMLRLPQNLSLYVEAGLASTENRFTTAKDLCDAYWDAKRKAIGSQHAEYDKSWIPLIDCLVSEMNERQALSVPPRVLDAFSPPFLQAMVSEGVLSFDGRSYSFGHETFFDYCFARTRPKGGREFVPLLERDPQELFRRAQLRQVLAFLRDEDFNAYLTNVGTLLRGEKFRAHLKLLVVELIAVHPSPHDEEFTLLMPWILSEFAARMDRKATADRFASRVWDTFLWSRGLFLAADRLGFVERWLCSNDPWLEDAMIVYLRWQAHSHADRVAELLDPFVEYAEWQSRLRSVVNVHDIPGSRRFFDFFLRLIANGTLDDDEVVIGSRDTFWSNLYGFGESSPIWCAEVAARWLDRQAIRVQNLGDGDRLIRLHDDSTGVENLLASARLEPLTFLSFVLPSLLRMAGCCVYGSKSEGFAHDSVWMGFISEEYVSLSDAYLQGCVGAFDAIGKQSPDSLRPFLSQLQSSNLFTANYLLMRAYLTNSEAFGEEALRLLVSDPRRLTPVWWARQNIEAHSAGCTDETYHLLESAVLNFVPADERTKDGMSSRGSSAYNLASGLSLDRLSPKAKVQIAEWEIKFKRPSGPPEASRCYTVVSPIDRNAATHMTDEQWLRALHKYNDSGRRWDPRHPEKGGAPELAGMMQQFVKEQPDRFAALALNFPEGTEPSYFTAVLRGLGESSASGAIRLAVARRCFVVDDRECRRAALDLLGSITEVGLPDDTIKYVKESAGYAEPGMDSQDDSPAYDRRDILTQGLNTVRGHAAGTIRDLIFCHPRYLTIFASTIDQLVTDPSISVRAVVASTIAAVEVHDADLSLDLLDRLVLCDDRLLATSYLIEIMARRMRASYDRFVPLIERMLRSSDDKVRNKGGVLAGLARLYHVRADFLSEKALNGDEHSKLGASEVARSNVQYPECQHWCETALIRLFADDALSIRKDAARCFWHFGRTPDLSLIAYARLMSVFLRSDAFADDPTYLLHAIEVNRHKIPEVVLDVCEVFVNRCRKAVRAPDSALAGDEHVVGKLVFTVYAQLPTQVLRTRVLDLVDEMALEGFTSTSTQLAGFDR